MKDSGVLTEEEFAQQKAGILSGGGKPAGNQVAPAPVMPVAEPVAQVVQVVQPVAPPGESQYERERREREERREYQDRQDRLERQERQERPERQERMQMERMQGERAMIANIQGLHAGGVNQKPTIPVAWLAGTWTRTGQNCCESTIIHGTVTPMGDNAFNFSYPRCTFTLDVGAAGGDVWTGHGGDVFKLTVFDENSFNMAWTNHGIRMDFFKDVPTSNKAKQGMAPVPTPQAPPPQVMHQPSAGKFHPVTGQPIPKFDPLTGMQNWWGAGEVRA